MRAILFDLDGVLIDSFESWFLAFNKTLRKFGLDEVTREEFREKYWGPELKDTAKRIGLDKDAIKYCNLQHINLIRHATLYPVVKKILKSIKIKNKFKMGLVTNTPRKNVRVVLKRFSLWEYFDVVIAGDDVNKGKPNPEMITKACNLLNVKPQDTILVGDTQADVAAGRAAGCTVIGIRTKGDLRIKKFEDLYSILEVM